MKHPDWQGVRRLLCIRLDQLGDVLMCTPAMHALKQSLPQLELDLLTSPAAAQLAPHLEDVASLLAWPAPWSKVSSPMCTRSMAARLRRRRYQAAIIFSSYSQSPLPAAMLCLQAGIPLRLAHCHENPYALLSHWLPDPEPQQQIRHEVQRQLDLVAHIGCKTAEPRLRFALMPTDLQCCESQLRLADMHPGRPIYLLHPGASAASRRYPPALWAQVAQALYRQGAQQIVLSGTSAEHALCSQIQSLADIPILNLAGRLSLGQLAALIARATVLISNNSGPVHLSAAVGTPVVDIYAMTNPQHIPWKVASRVLFHETDCAYCYSSVCPSKQHPCMNGITPERVVSAALSLAHPAPRSR